MNSLDCKLERVSNAMVGTILLFVGLVLTILGITVIPIIGLFFALVTVILDCAFLLAPRSESCALVAQKLRGTVVKR